MIRSRAVLIAIGIDWEGRRQVLAVELANRESASSWQEFLIKLKERGLHGLHLVVTDQHEGLKQAIAKVLPTALWPPRASPHTAQNLPRTSSVFCLFGGTAARSTATHLSHCEPVANFPEPEWREELPAVATRVTGSTTKKRGGPASAQHST